MANIKKYDYLKICKGLGLDHMREENPYVYFKDSMGFEHKRSRSDLIRGGGATIKSLLDKSLASKYFLESLKVKSPEVFSKSSFEKFTYTGALSYAIATCLTHGDYRTKPNWLLTRGHHCKKCGLIRNAENKHLSQEEFLEKSRKVHGDRYDYSKTEYVSSRNYVTITCKLHGDFSSVAYYHIQGNGCQVCGIIVGGYSRSDYKKICPNGSNVYIMKFTIGEDVFIKIGVSKEVDRRINVLSRETGGVVSLIHKEFFTDAGVAWDVEQMLHKDFSDESYKPDTKFAGSTECFDLSIKDEVIKVLQCIS